MCNPVAIAAASVAGSVVTAYGRYKAGEAQEQINDNNALVARRAALDALSRGAAEAGRQTMEGSRVIGKARSAAGASGVDVASSSVLDVLGTTRMYAKLNAETAKANAAREAAGLRAQADNFEAAGDAAKSEALFGAVATLLGGAGSIASALTKAPTLGKG